MTVVDSLDAQRIADSLARAVGVLQPQHRHHSEGKMRAGL
jgi:hypothetical protein